MFKNFRLNINPNFYNKILLEFLKPFINTKQFTDLWDFCLEMICEEPKVLFNSDKLINLKTPLLELLLKRYDLDLNEIEIWENLLKWRFVQHNVKNDPTKWSKEDITKVEKSTQIY